MGVSGSKDDGEGYIKRLSNGSVRSNTDKNKSKSFLERKKVSNDEILGPKPVELTQNEKSVIRETWKDVEDSVAKVGVVMFIKLFETHPDVQDSFLSFRNEDLVKMQHSKQLKNHALRVMGFVQKAVSRLDEPEKLTTLLTDLGSKHFQYSVNPIFIDLVGPQFISAIQGSLESTWEEEAETAWLHLFSIMTYQMKTAMLQQPAVEY